MPENISYWAEHKDEILKAHNWPPGSFTALQFERKLTNGELVGFFTSPNTFAAIAVLPGIGAGAIASAVREVTGMLPDVSIHFEESGPAALIDAMLMDMLDCALVPDDCDLPERLNRWTLYQETASVFLPAGHRLGAQNAVTAREILEETILVGDRCGGFAQNLVGITGFSLRLQRCNGTAAQMLDLVGAGLGIALLSDRLQVPPQLQTRRFTDPDLSRRILLTAVAGRPLNPAAASFIKLCRAQAYS